MADVLGMIVRGGAYYDTWLSPATLTARAVVTAHAVNSAVPASLTLDVPYTGAEKPWITIDSGKVGKITTTFPSAGICRFTFDYLGGSGSGSVLYGVG